MAKRHSRMRSHSKKMHGGVGATGYAELVYGAAGQQHAGHGNAIAMNSNVQTGGKKSNMNFMMMPKMFMRMTRSRKHRRKSKRHHGKSRKHKK